MKKTLQTQPVYLQLADILQEKIEAGEYTVGTKIPSERELTEQFGISRMTVRKAIEVLMKKGHLTRIQGKGTYVNLPKLDSPISIIRASGKMIQEAGMQASNKVLYSGIRAAGIKYGRIFQIAADALLFQLCRIRLGNEKPVALEYTFLPADLIPDLTRYDFQQTSLYQLLAQHHIEIQADHQQLEIVTIDDPQAKLLGIPEHTPVFMLHNTVTDTNGRVIEHTRSYVSGDMLTFTSLLT